VIPENLKYSKEHEWVKLEGEIATVGITHHAQDQLGDIVYVEQPSPGTKLSTMQEFGVVESVKTVSTLYCPLGGEVVEINEALKDRPETVNDDPYGTGWIMKLKLTDTKEIDALLDSEQYKQLVEAK